MKSKYYINEEKEFVIEDYNRAKPFASFLPAIAGLYGKPLWAYYVNRGQCMATIGVNNKDNAIMEFYPADKAYRMTPREGFRTFLKIKKGDQIQFHEPFQDAPGRAAAIQKMRITSHDLSLEEQNPALGLTAEVMYCTLPGECLAGLIRKLTLTNTSDADMEIETADGLPAVIPYYLTTEDIKRHSNLRRAWMGVSGVDSIPFYKISVLPDDSPETAFITGGYYYASFYFVGDKPSLCPMIVDPTLLFGHRADFSWPEEFVKSGFAVPQNQPDIGFTPCGFGWHKTVLRAGEQVSLYALVGKADSHGQIQSLLANHISETYMREKIQENRLVIDTLKQHILTVSSAENFDLYCGQTMLDNILRGGYPIQVGEGKHSYYVYSRKHGDLEREYNFFQVDSTNYSQGNANFRDVNQNRRSDVVFFPFIEDANVKTFMNLIQLDGFNPLVVKGSSFRIADEKKASALTRTCIEEPSRQIVTDFLQKSFIPGGLLTFLEQNGIRLPNVHVFLDKALAAADKVDEADFQEGYWVDHWTYNNDLLEQFVSVFPDKAEGLLYGQKEYTYYDSYERVLPRDRKYVLTDNGVRQYGALKRSPEKLQLIQSRPDRPFLVRTENGRGTVYRTTLIAKLFTLIVNKIASMDAAGTGIEMEAGKPGWCDALNGLPGILGSSINESAELKRLAQIILNWPGIRKSFLVHEELHDFYRDIKRLFDKNIFGHAYWEQATGAKEAYREKVFLGVSGQECEISADELTAFLHAVISTVDAGLDQARDAGTGVCRTFFINEVSRYEALPGCNENGLQYVKAIRFTQRPIAYFMEGPMHVMRTMKDGHKALYRAIKKTGLYDEKLDMYKVNENIMDETKEIGRQNIFPRGWLENESVFLHMEYKYFFELLRAGLYEEFYHCFRHSMVPFLDPEVYGRSILENSSFIASSAHPDERVHGGGYVSRLTGASAEVLNMWLIMTCGPKPFTLDAGGTLQLTFTPSLPGWLFTEEEKAVDVCDADGSRHTLTLDKNCFAFRFLGRTLAVYHNDSRKDTFGPDAAGITEIRLRRGGETTKIEGGVIPAPLAGQVRDGLFDRVDIVLK